MTDEEINRKFEIVANHLATLAVRLDQVGEAVDALGGKVNSLAEAQRRTEGSIQALLTIAEIQSEEIRQLGDSVKIIDGRQRQTDERLNMLIDLFERDISERRNGRKKSEGNGDEQAGK
jgi:hypothetical protein